MTTKRGFVRAVIALVGAMMLAVVSSPVPAAAALRDGKCDVGEFCLYWGPGRTGSVSDFNGSVPDYGDAQPGCYEFKKPNAAGYRECVKHNAMSAWNRTTANTVTVYRFKNYVPPADVFTPGQSKELNNTWLHNASHRFVHN
jgi:hypothetical protein